MASSGRSFHLKQWLSVQQAVDHLSALAEESLSGADLADLAETRQLDLYWYRPGQLLAYVDRGANAEHPLIELDQPLRLCPESRSDWLAVAGILRGRPALPAAENDTPLLEDADGRRLRITFAPGRWPEPYSSRWYPSLAELVLKRSDMPRLESRLFSAADAEQFLEQQLLLDVIWDLEQLALDGGDGHDTAWLAEQLARRDPKLDRNTLERVLHAAEHRREARAPHPP